MLVAQSCPTLDNPMNCSLPGSSVHGILQARILEWVAIPFCRGSQPRDWTQISCIGGEFFTIWATRAASVCWYKCIFLVLWQNCCQTNNSNEQTSGDSERQESLACCSPWGQSRTQLSDRTATTFLWFFYYWRKNCTSVRYLCICSVVLYFFFPEEWRL